MILQNFGPKPNLGSVSGHSERISPGPIRSKVGHQIALNNPPGYPTLERIGPGEFLSE